MTKSRPHRRALVHASIAPAKDQAFPMLKLRRPLLLRRDKRRRYPRRRAQLILSTLLNLMAHSALSALALLARKTVEDAGGPYKRHCGSLGMRRNVSSSAPSAQTLSKRSTIGRGTKSRCIFLWRNGYVLHLDR